MLCYHGVSDRWGSDLGVAPALLEKQVSSLVERGYEPTTFTRAVTDPPAERTLAVTFDDGYKSVLELGLPVLEPLGAPGTIFVPTDFVGSPEPMSWTGIEEWTEGSHRDELVPLDWDELRHLVDAGWEVGSHTCSHPRLPEIDAAAVERELTDSKAEITARLGACPSLAYPYGAVSPPVIEAARAAGYDTAAALDRRMRASERLRWPRVGVYESNPDWVFRLKTSPRVRRMAARLG